MKKLNTYTTEELLQKGAISFGKEMIITINLPNTRIEQYFKELHSNVWIYSHQKKSTFITLKN